MDKSFSQTLLHSLVLIELLESISEYLDTYVPLLVAVLSKAQVHCLSVSGIAYPNPAEDMNVDFLCLFCRQLPLQQLVTCAEEANHSCVSQLCVIQQPQKRQLRLDFECNATKKIHIFILWSSAIKCTTCTEFCENMLLVSWCVEIPIFHVLLHQFCDLPSLLL